MSIALELRLKAVWGNAKPARYVPRGDDGEDEPDRYDDSWRVYDRRSKVFLSDDRVLTTPLAELASATHYDG